MVVAALPPVLSFLAASPPARRSLALAGAAACGLAALSGLYPTYGSSATRLLVACTTTVLAYLVVRVALRASTEGRAILVGTGLSVLLGGVNALAPAWLAAGYGTRSILLAAVVAGGMTGFFYGMPLALLAALGLSCARENTAEGDDRALRIASAALAAGAAFTCLGAGRHAALEPSALGLPEAFAMAPAYAAGIAGAFGVAGVVLSGARLRRRARWLARVASGLEPGYVVRPLEESDGGALAGGVPRLGAGTWVLASARGETASGEPVLPGTGSGLPVLPGTGSGLPVLPGTASGEPVLPGTGSGLPVYRVSARGRPLALVRAQEPRGSG